MKPCCHTNLVYVWQRRSTNDKVSGKVPVQAKSGRKAYLTDEEEDRPAEFLVGCASVGYAKSCRDVLAIAQQVFNARNPDCDVELTKGWCDRFRKRHPEILFRQRHFRMPERLPTTQKSLKHTLTCRSKRLKQMALHIVQGKYSIVMKQECP